MGEWAEDNWLIEDDYGKIDPLGEPNPQKFVYRACRLLHELEADGASLLLRTFGRLGLVERKVLLKLFGIEAHGVDAQDIASTLSAIAYTATCGRTNAVLAQKVEYFQRAIELIGDLRRGWSSEQWFAGPQEQENRHASLLSLKEALAIGEEELKSAITALSISPCLVDRRWLAETFYFAFLVDHENLWSALVRQIRANYPHIAAYRTHPKAKFCFFEPAANMSHSDGKKDDDLAGWINHDSYKAFQPEHKQLIRYVISNLLCGLRTHCGVPLFDYGDAVAYWRYFPESHQQEFKNRGLDTPEPDLPVQKKSEAADRKISRHMTTRIWELAKAQNKKPLFVLVSGDSDYLETLYDLRRRGADCQYWLFKSRVVSKGDSAARLRGLGEERLVWLDDLLRLDAISEETLHNWHASSGKDPVGLAAT